MVWNVKNYCRERLNKLVHQSRFPTKHYIEEVTPWGLSGAIQQAAEIEASRSISGEPLQDLPFPFIFRLTFAR